MTRAGWSRRWLAALAVCCVATAAASTAQAQKLAGDPSRCGNSYDADRLRYAMDDVYGALYQIKLLKAYVQTVLAASPASMRQEYVIVTGLIDREQAALQRYPQGSGEPLRELKARRDLLLQAMTDAELGLRTDPDRNPYAPRIQKATDDLARTYDRYTQIMLACGQTPGEVAPATGPDRAQANAGAPPPTIPPQAATAPPPTASTGNPAGGRIRFRPMSEADAQQMANAIAPNAPLTGAMADLSAWGGAYVDDAANRYDLAPGTPGYLGVVGGPAGNASGIIVNWDDCRMQGAGVVCNFNGELRGSDGGVAVAGRVAASRSGGVITGTYTLNGVKPLWGQSGTISAGQVMGFTYRPN